MVWTLCYQERSYGAIELYDPQSQNPERTWVVNGQRLKLYHGRLICSNVQIIQQVPNDQMHEKPKITQIETGLPPRERFFNVISLSLLPHWAILCFGSHLQNLLTFSHYLQANIVF